MFKGIINLVLSISKIVFIITACKASATVPPLKIVSHKYLQQFYYNFKNVYW